VKHYIYKRRIHINDWNSIEPSDLTRVVEGVGWEGVDEAMKKINGNKKMIDVHIEITPDFSDDPLFREIVVTVDYEPLV